LTAPWSRYRIDDGCWTDTAQAITISRRKQKRQKKKGSKKQLPFSTRIQERVPGNPKPAETYETALFVTVMRVDARNGPFSRRLEGEGIGEGWKAIEPRAAFDPWPLYDATGRHVCDIAFWTDQRGRQFAVGMDCHQVIWWLTPVDPSDLSPKLWSLKRQLPAEDS
jgi:hypothetical protein